MTGRAAGAAARATTRIPTGLTSASATCTSSRIPRLVVRAPERAIPSRGHERRARPSRAAPRRRAARARPARARRRVPAEAAHAWRAQIESRAIDHAARWLQAQKLGFYTIGSAGHESNALVALALSPTDPALLHYRSGGFYLARAGQAGRDGAWDVLLGMAAAAEEPIARRPAQGLRPPRPRGHPADVDHRVAPAARRRHRLRDRAREGARRRVGLAAGRDRRLLVRRRVAEPRDGAVCAQRGGPLRLPRASAYRSSSSARTTASGSACRRPRAGSSSRSTAGPSSPSSASTGTTRPPCSPLRRSSRSGSARTVTPPCSICGPCAT